MLAFKCIAVTNEETDICNRCYLLRRFRNSAERALSYLSPSVLQSVHMTQLENRRTDFN
jgi:hypothetical protein